MRLKLIGGFGRFFSNLTVSFMFLALSACSTTWYPTSFATVQEAFPDASSMIPLESEPTTFEKATFNASYEDVYRAALVSASQIQLNVKVENKRDGYILAKKIQVGGNAGRVYYAIVVKEKGGRETEVTIMTKTQSSCPHGLGHKFEIDSFSAREMKRLGVSSSNWCPDYLATVHWAGVTVDNNQFITFVRNNLIAAGLY